MRVLFLTNIPTPYRVDFFNELGKRCDLTVLYERETATDRDKKWQSDTNKTYKSVFLRGKKIKNDAAICLSVIKWIDSKKFDIFVVGGYSTPTGMIAIKTLNLKKIPFILNSDGGFIKRDNKLIKLMKNYFISSAKWWLSTGNLTNNYLENYGANKNNIFIYPFTSLKDEDILKKTIPIENKVKIRKKIGIDTEKVVLSVGRYIYSKGYDWLIKTWLEIKENYTLIIIGSGPEQKNLENIIYKNKLKNIKLIGFKNKNELEEYYLCADLFILPTRSDVWGLVINEAMAYGLPVITTKMCNAGLELIEDEINGYIVDVEDTHVLKEKINLILDNYDLRNNMSKNNIDKIKNYSIKKMAERHKEIFSICEENK